MENENVGRDLYSGEPFTEEERRRIRALVAIDRELHRGAQGWRAFEWLTSTFKATALYIIFVVGIIAAVKGWLIGWLGIGPK